MSERKIIAVVGATGTQGGGLARAVLADEESGFAVRALTRNPDSDAARSLADQGADVVRADLDEPATVEKAFQGAWGAFCVTNFWESFSPEREQRQARAMAAAAKAVELRHVIWSTLEDTREYVPVDDDRMPTLMESYKVPHYDSKGEADRFFRDEAAPTTFFRTSFYWDNLIHFGMEPKRGEDGILRLVLPMGNKRLPGIAAADIGKCAYGVFKRGEEMVGRTVGIAGGHLTGYEMAAGLTRALGEEVRYEDVSPETYRSFGFPGAEDLGNMFQFKQEFEAAYCGARPVEATRDLNPELQSFDEWASRNASRIPID